MDYAEVKKHPWDDEILGMNPTHTRSRSVVYSDGLQSDGSNRAALRALT